jgi:thymidylate synthase ThyX
MGYEARVLADSVTEFDDRLTTLEVTFPRFVLPEFNTHRVFSRNSASSRAVPVEKRLLQVLDEPVIPIEWGANKPGMQSIELLSESDQLVAESEWLKSRDHAIIGAVALVGGLGKMRNEALVSRVNELYARYNLKIPEPIQGVHKQFVNRILEPYMWHTVVVSSTEWDNFMALRRHPDAQPEIRKVADLMDDAIESSEPMELGEGQWHLPFVLEEERTLSFDILAKLAVARCARVSYETHDTGKIDQAKDIALHDSLRDSGHMSPFEHVARPMTIEEYMENPWSGNFLGWHQYRKDIPYEDNYLEAQQ